MLGGNIGDKVEIKCGDYENLIGTIEDVAPGKIVFDDYDPEEENFGIKITEGTEYNNNAEIGEVVWVMLDDFQAIDGETKTFKCKMVYQNCWKEVLTHEYQWEYEECDEDAASIAKERFDKKSRVFKDFLCNELDSMTEGFEEIISWEVIA